MSLSASCFLSYNYIHTLTAWSTFCLIQIVHSLIIQSLKSVNYAYSEPNNRLYGGDGEGGMGKGTRFNRPSCCQPLFGACVKSGAEKQLKVGHRVGGEKEATGWAEGKYITEGRAGRGR